MAEDLALRPHRRASFSYKTISPIIRQVLDNRSALDNTVQMSMPFIKVTSTMQNPDILGYGNQGFTLGLHATELDAKFDDIYSNKNGDAYLGYTYTSEGKTQKVYVRPDRSGTQQYGADIITSANLFDVSSNLYDTPKSAAFIPPPGITRATISRYKNGLLAQAQINFSVPTLQQLEILHRIFLVPGAGMVVEWGQQFALEKDISTATIFDSGETGINVGTIDNHMFPWYDVRRRNDLLLSLGRKEVSLQKILNEYVYPTQGQYMWLFGRVGNFSTRGNSDGSYECTLKIIGASEDAWAYTTRHTVIPGSDSSRTICVGDTNSVESYFTTTTNGLNLKTLLEGTRSGGILPEWKDHVQYFENGNKKAGETASDGNANADQTAFSDSQDAYFMTWRFFVNVVLNHPERGLRAIYENAGLLDDELDKITFLRQYEPTNTTPTDMVPIVDPYENFVGNNKYLRSYDPSTLIIVNEAAVNEFEEIYKQQGIDTSKLIGAFEDEAVAFSNKRKFDFYKSTKAVSENSPDVCKVNEDKGFLSTGVWINHQAVCTSMLGAETILRGVANLLNRMNAATMGYWQLSIDEINPIPTDGPASTTLGYTVVDLNYQESVQTAVDEFLKNVHVFNKYIRTKDGRLVGSELIDSSIDLNLPKRLFAQIATLGLATKEQLTQVGSDDSNDENSPIISDVNDTLRRMFSITSISERLEDGQYADLTYNSTPSARVYGQCAAQASQTEAGAGGTGNSVAPAEPVEPGSTNELNNRVKNYRAIVNSKDCQEYFASQSRAQVTFAGPLADASCTDATGPTGKDPYPRPPELQQYENAKLPLTVLKGVEKSSTRARSYYTYKGEPNWFLLYPEAADKYLQLKAAADAAGVKFTLSSAYRDFRHQNDLASTGRGAATGTSPHGWGGAIDIAELFDAAKGGSTDPSINKSVRQNNATYKWLRENAPKFGWYNPCRMADGLRNDEVWHWEYWGSRGAPFNPTQPQTSETVLAREQAERDATAPSTNRNVLTPGGPGGGVAVQASSVARRYTAEQCIKAQDGLSKTETVLQKQTTVDNLKERFKHLNAIFRYIEPFPDFMVAKIRNSSDDNSSNAFGSAPGTLSITTDMTLPGINGIRIGELFWVDRMPTFYRAFGAFQVMSLEDTIGVDGWTTKIQGRFNYLGATWREQMAKKLASNP